MSENLLLLADASGISALEQARAAESSPSRSLILEPASSREFWEAVEETLATAKMGLRVSVFGTQATIVRFRALAHSFGMGPEEIKIHPTSPEMRIYCPHCGSVFEPPLSDPLECFECGRPLDVRDHFSSRLGAHLGVGRPGPTVR